MTVLCLSREEPLGYRIKENQLILSYFLRQMLKVNKGNIIQRVTEFHLRAGLASFRAKHPLLVLPVWFFAWNLRTQHDIPEQSS